MRKNVILIHMTHRVTAAKIAEFGAAILICEFAGFIGSLFTAPAIPGWYASLTRPALSPPSIVFPIVWTLLYAAMGIALGLVSQSADKALKSRGLTLFGIQLFLNVAWSLVFFGLRNVLGGLIVLIMLWFAVFLTTTSFFRISRSAAGCMIPYIVWITFALYLNASILALNTLAG
jgi:translocator protein